MSTLKERLTNLPDAELFELAHDRLELFEDHLEDWLQCSNEADRARERIVEILAKAEVEA